MVDAGLRRGGRSLAELFGQRSGDDLLCFVENRADYGLAAADVLDQAFGLAGPPHAAFDVSVAVHLFAVAVAAGQVSDVTEGGTRLA